MSIKLIIWIIGVIIYFIYKIVSSAKNKTEGTELIVDNPIQKTKNIQKPNPAIQTSSKASGILKDKPVQKIKKTTNTPVVAPSPVVTSHTLLNNEDLKPAQLQHFEIVPIKPHPLKLFLNNKSNLKKAFITSEILQKKSF